ncbi:MAG: fasciclin domain-containing protein [Rhizobiaceae bacterium]
MKKFLIGTALALSFAAAPASAGNIVETAEGAGTFGTLIAAAKAAGLDGALATGKDLTVFAPTDEAFKKLPAGTVEDLLKPENKDKLAAILSYHVVGSKIMAADIKDGSQEVKTIKEGGDNMIEVVKSADGVMVDGAKVVTADVAADNGVIHVIDAVILPKD